MGGIQFLADAMLKFSKVGLLQEYACAALGNLSLTETTLGKMKSEPHVHEALLEAHKNFGRSPHGKFALSILNKLKRGCPIGGERVVYHFPREGQNPDGWIH